MRPVVMMVRFSEDGRFRGEVGDFVTWCAAWRLENPDKITDLLLTKFCGMQPVPVARNRAVQVARKHYADMLCMVDDDMAPDPNFFPGAVEFLAKHPGPAVLAVPYCCAGPHEEVMAFEWTSFESNDPSSGFKLERIPRADAARRSGIGQVNNVGTGCILYRMDAFDAIQPPYYDYGYNADHTEITETEDCWCHRRMVIAGVPFYVDWDHWAGHAKVKVVPKPRLIDQAYIDQVYLSQAEAALRAKQP